MKARVGECVFKGVVVVVDRVKGCVGCEGEYKVNILGLGCGVKLCQGERKNEGQGVCV